jgi:hypothetical protein
MFRAASLRAVARVGSCLLACAALAAAQGEADRPLLEFAARVEETIAQRDASYLDGRMDMEAFLSTVTRGIEAPPGFEQGFRKGVRSRSGSMLAERLVATLEQEQGSYTFLRLLPGQPRRALFRCVSGAGVNYHELLLTRGARGEVVYTDVYIHLSGELLSDTLRRAYLAGVAQESRGVLDELMGKEVAYVKHMPQIKRLAELVQQRQHAQALQAWQALPAEVQQQSEVLLLRVQAAAGVSEPAYEEAMAAFAAAWPDSPALTLMSIDRHVLRKEWAQAQAALDKVDARVGGDPYLDLVRAGVFVQSGQPAQARARCEAAMRREAGLAYPALCALLDVLLAEKDWRATAETLTRLEREHGVTWKDLTEVEAFAGFVRTPEFQEWLKRPRQRE